jgi:hypothetical protein
LSQYVLEETEALPSILLGTFRRAPVKVMTVGHLLAVIQKGHWFEEPEAAEARDNKSD